MLTELFIIVGLILVNGVFAGAEIAVVAVRASRVRELVERGSGAARALGELRSDPERFLSTIQVVITVVAAAAAAFGGSAFAEDLAPWVAEVAWLAPYSEELALGLIVTLIAVISLLFGELVPKSLALRNSESYALFIARPLLWLARVFALPVRLLTGAANLVLRLFGDHTTFMESRISLEELRAIVGEAQQHGSVQPHAGAIASRALEFAELTAVDVMVHRSFVQAVSRQAGAREIEERVLAGVHQRFPVYDGTLDNVLGYVSWRDILPLVRRGEPLALDALVRPTIFVPQSQSAPALLEDMRRRRLHLAIVVDEHGGAAGIVTLEDLLEELVGEITSEHSKSEYDGLERDASGAVLLPASYAIREVNRELQLALDEPDDVTTLGGLAVRLARDHIPRVGERLTAQDGAVLEIVDASPRRVRTVKVSPPPPNA